MNWNKNKRMFLLSSWSLFCCLLFLSSSSQTTTVVAQSDDLTCSISDHETGSKDPALRELIYDLGQGPQSILAYVTPDVTSFYPPGTTPPAKTAVKPKFKGLSAKFVNLSNQKLRLYWRLSANSTLTSLIRAVGPFSATGTSSFPGHHFFFSSDAQPDEIVQSFVVRPYPENIYYYDPYFVPNDMEATRRNLNALAPDELEQYQEWNVTRAFNEIYRNFTQRSYLPRYLRKPPMHFMWPADHFGQQHWVTTKETHLVYMPPADQLQAIEQHGRSRILTEAQPRLLAEYRDPYREFLNMTLTVLSCAPRVFEIQNFLSSTEVDHILQIAGGITLSESGVGDGELPDKSEVEKRKTRTSFNSWVRREASPIIDAIYRRAADVLRIDESLLRARPDGERPELPYTSAFAEHLQLVHYDIKQQYQAHHDFGYRDNTVDGQQPERFATLLLYLNEGMKGGETSFPRWINAASFEAYKVTPQVGKAVLFYSQLPDGNFDDFSQHAALPVVEGEKWLINLWVWDPIFAG